MALTHNFTLSCGILVSCPPYKPSTGALDHGGNVSRMLRRVVTCRPPACRTTLPPLLTQWVVRGVQPEDIRPPQQKPVEYQPMRGIPPLREADWRRDRVGRTLQIGYFGSPLNVWVYRNHWGRLRGNDSGAIADNLQRRESANIANVFMLPKISCTTMTTGSAPSLGHQRNRHGISSP